MSEDLVRDLLRSVAEADSSAEAPPEVEIQMRKKFRSWKRKGRRRRAAVWIRVGAAAVIIVLVFLSMDRTPRVLPVQEAVVMQDPILKSESDVETPPPVIPIKPTPVPRRTA